LIFPVGLDLIRTGEGGSGRLVVNNFDPPILITTSSAPAAQQLNSSTPQPSGPRPPRIDLSRRSSTPLAKADPYATKTHRRIDIALVVITLVLMVFAFRLSAHQRATDNSNRAQQSQIAPKK